MILNNLQPIALPPSAKLSSARTGSPELCAIRLARGYLMTTECTRVEWRDMVPLSSEIIIAFLVSVYYERHRQSHVLFLQAFRIWSCIRFFPSHKPYLLHRCLDTAASPACKAQSDRQRLAYVFRVSADRLAPVKNALNQSQKPQTASRNDNRWLPEILHIRAALLPSVDYEPEQPHFLLRDSCPYHPSSRFLVISSGRIISCIHYNDSGSSGIPK